MGRGRPHKCPYCEATKSVAKGFRYNKAGKVRLRRCKDCGRRWTTGLVPDEMEEIPRNFAAEPPGENPGFEELDFTNQAESAEKGEEQREVSRVTEETGTEEERRTELPLSGEEGPSHEDPGEERTEEFEETFFVQ